jgi:hypothetical protein
MTSGPDWFAVVTEGLFGSFLKNQVRGGEQWDEGTIRVPLYDAGNGRKERFALTFGFNDQRRQDSVATLLVADPAAGGTHTWCVARCRQRHLPNGLPCDGRESCFLRATFRELADGEEGTLFLMQTGIGFTTSTVMMYEKLSLTVLYGLLHDAVDRLSPVCLVFQRLAWHWDEGQPSHAFVLCESVDAMMTRLEAPTRRAQARALSAFLFRYMHRPHRVTPGRLLPDDTIQLPTVRNGVVQDTGALAEHPSPFGVCVGFEDPARRDSYAVLLQFVRESGYRWAVVGCRQTHPGAAGPCDGRRTHLLDASLAELSESDDPLSALVLIDGDLTDTKKDIPFKAGRVSLYELYVRLTGTPDTAFYLWSLTPSWPCRRLVESVMVMHLHPYAHVQSKGRACPYCQRV